MNIIENFPIIKPGYLIDVIDPCGKLLLKVPVISVWYPKKGDKWNERDECRTIGYLCSRSEEAFPQIACNTPNGVLIACGTDLKDIKGIYTKSGNPIKHLSDGTVAKVGMIVVVMDAIALGNYQDTVTCITKLNPSTEEEARYMSYKHIACEAINSTPEQFYTYNRDLVVKIRSWVERVHDLRKATPEERKQYYANKFSK